MQAFLDGPIKQEPVKDGYAFLDISNLAMAAVFAQQGAMQYVPEGTFIPEIEKNIKQEMSLPFVRFLILNTLAKNVKTFRDQYPNIVLCFDNSEGGYWRKRVAPYYKQNRKEDRSVSTFPFEDYFKALNVVKQELKDVFPYYVLDVKSAEADDCIAVCTKYLSLNNKNSMIISADGDFKQLQTFDHIKQWSPTQKKYVEVTKYEAQVEKMTKILKGDRKDNVAPIKTRSNYWLTRIEGERAPSVTKKLVEACVEPDADFKALLTEQEFERFEENQKLIDFNFIAEDIHDSIIDEFKSYKVNSRSGIYSYLARTGNSVMATRIGDF